MAFTGVPDADRGIFFNLPPMTVLAMCQVNQYTNNVCNNEFFWQQKIIQDFGEEVLSHKPALSTYRQQYNYLANLIHPDVSASEGRVDGLIVLRNYGYQPTVDGVVNVFRYGHLNVLDWFHRKDPTFYNRYYGIDINRKNVWLWLRENGFDVPDAIYMAGKLGDLSLLPNNLTASNWVVLARQAAMHGQIDLLNWVAERNVYPSSEDMDIAAQYNQVEVLKWGELHQILPTDKVISVMIEYYNLATGYGGNVHYTVETLVWLADHGYYYTNYYNPVELPWRK
jgi:hypothetical protein